MVTGLGAGPRISRRALVYGAAAVAAVGRLTPTASAQAILTDDGLYRQPWFLDSLLELAPDLEEASSKGKRFLIMWELKGCPACKQTHLVNFATPAIANFVQERFEVLQLNLIGSREVVDFDGEKLAEKRLAEKYGIRGTPTFQFFPERTDDIAAKAPRAREAARAQGYVEPRPFLTMFRFVAEGGYERGSLDDFLRSQS
jgi:thioredoxin-related protein